MVCGDAVVDGARVAGCLKVTLTSASTFFIFAISTFVLDAMEVE